MSSTLSQGHGPAWPSMGLREGLHKSVLLCVSGDPSAASTLVSWGCCLEGVLSSVGYREPSGGSDHPQAPVGTQRPHCSPRASTAQRGPPPGRSREAQWPKFLAGAPGSSLRQPMLHMSSSSGQNTMARLAMSRRRGRQVSSLARPVASSSWDGPEDSNSQEKSHETHRSVLPWAHSEDRTVILAGPKAECERGSRLPREVHHSGFMTFDLEGWRTVHNLHHGSTTSYSWFLCCFHFFPLYKRYGQETS